MIINKPEPRTHKITRIANTTDDHGTLRESNRSLFLNDFISELQCYTRDQDKENRFCLKSRTRVFTVTLTR